MEKIIWDESFSVGVSELDHQHGRIIAIINLLLDEPKSGFDQRMVAKILADLTNYAHDHFETEEQLLAENGYPDLHAQHNEHKAFRITLAEFCDDSMNNRAPVPPRVLNYLKNWWVDHILVKDMKYRSFLNERGVM